jgi:hypothetical protein
VIEQHKDAASATEEEEEEELGDEGMLRDDEGEGSSVEEERSF